MPTSSPRLNITIELAEVSDYPRISEIDIACFDGKDLSVVAFGPQGRGQGDISKHVEEMLEDNEPFAEHVRMKAVLHHPSGESEIIGFSDWAFVTNRDLEAEKIYEAEEKAKWENMTPEEREHHTEWGPNSNAKLCEEVFERGDEIMYESCERRDYSSLKTLAVIEAYQRKGVGSMLLEHGLAKVDSLGLQSVLSSAPESEKLYERYGYRVIHEMMINLEAYEGGENMHGKTE